MEFDEVKLPSNWEEWKIVEWIGHGSFSDVYKAERKIGSTVFTCAIKVIPIPKDKAYLAVAPSYGKNKESVSAYYKGLAEECVKEIELMYKLKGISNIISIEDYELVPQEDGICWTAFIRMEYLQDIKKYACTHTMTASDIIRLGTDIATALEYCEKNGILHRDIKPENIFVSEHGNYKLGDFGVSKIVSQTVSSLSYAGTELYMAPEVYRNEPYGRTADIYSLGLVLYELLNKSKLPFEPLEKQFLLKKDREAALSKRLNKEPLPAPSDASPELATVVLKACAFDAKDRYQSATELKKALLAAENAILGKDLRDEKPRSPAAIRIPLIALCAALVLTTIILIPRTTQKHDTPQASGTPIQTQSLLEEVDNKEAATSKPEAIESAAESAAEETPEPTQAAALKGENTTASDAEKESEPQPELSTENTTTAEVVEEESASDEPKELPAESHAPTETIAVPDAESEEAISGSAEISGIDTMNLQPGDTVSFGTYLLKQGGEREPLHWIVLSADDSSVLLLSESAIACRPFLSERAKTTWEKSEVRQWLNDEFLYDSFSDAEIELIIQEEVPAEANPKYQTNPGRPSNDRAFLLSVAEVQKHLSGRMASYRICRASDYAISDGAYVSADGSTRWLLRTPGGSPDLVTCVDTNGVILGSEDPSSGLMVTYSRAGIRPAIRLKK